MRYVRRRKFVDVRVQGALVRRVVLHWLSFAVCLALVLAAMQYFLNPLASLEEQSAMFARRHGLTFLVLLLLLPAFAWDTVRISNRFAGPILRLHRMMKELAEGKDPGELHFRYGDFWCELAEQLNSVRDALKQARAAQTSRLPDREVAAVTDDQH